MAEAIGLDPVRCRFESCRPHHGTGRGTECGFDSHMLHSWGSRGGQWLAPPRVRLPLVPRLQVW